jgi:hypothetical protein
MWSCWIFPDRSPPRPTLPCRSYQSIFESMAGSIVAGPDGNAADALRCL